MYVWGRGSQGPRSPRTTRTFAYPPLPLPSSAANAAAAAALRPPWGARLGTCRPPNAPQPRVGAGQCPESLFCHGCPHWGWAFFRLFLSASPVASVAQSRGKGGGGLWGAGEGRWESLETQGSGGAEGLSYLKWLCMILILIYTKLLRRFSLRNRPLPLIVFTVFVKIVQCKYVFIIKS